MEKKVVITQSNYIPWKGYFDAIKLSDEFILYDDMQYTRRDWRNRNKIKTPRGIIWLTIPVEVKGKYFQKINETYISEKGWNLHHWQTIKQNYAKAKCFNEVKNFIEELYVNANHEMLSEINYYFLRNVCDYLEIKTPIRFSSEFILAEGKTERLVDLCKQLGTTDYYSGPKAKGYVDENLFEEADIKLHYFNHSGYGEYEQLYPPFEHAVSIIDLLCCEGKQAACFLKY
ncbi:MAG: WbqC family protein [Bacteroidia bacterium]